MEKTQKFQLVHVGPTNLGQHFTTDLGEAYNDEQTKTICAVEGTIFQTF